MKLFTVDIPGTDQTNTDKEKMKPFEQPPSTNNYNEIGTAYQQVITANKILFPVYRDLGDVINRNISHLLNAAETTLHVLDFGCGPGTSTPLILKSFNGRLVNIKLTGVDRNEANIIAAKAKNPDNIDYQLIEANKVPTSDQHFDVICCFWVCLEQKSREDLAALFIELHRVLKKTGRLLTVNNHEQLYNDRLKFRYEDNQVPGNREIYDNNQSGAQIGLRSIDDDNNEVIFRDFFWTRADYKSAASVAQLECVDEHVPVGLDTDGIPWKEGDKLGAYHIQVFKRSG